MDPNCSTSPSAITENCSAGNGPRGADSEETDDAKDEEASNADEQNDLEDFRLKWHKEIKDSPSRSSSSKKIKEGSSEKSDPSNDVSQQIEEQARTLFLMGVQAERSGLLESAISYYRRAVQLVPDIEFRIAEQSNENTPSSNSFSDDSDDSSDKENMMYDDIQEPEMCNLLEKFQKVAFNVALNGICQPNVEQKGTHISTIPPEIFIFILKWVVSSELDLISLEQISKVCRGFYLCARDSEIWRLACLRIWDMNLGSFNKYGSWRSMFIQRPHILFNGSYISKTTYLRYGEPSFQDSNYRPCYLVSYFRYIRFFPDGHVLMLTTPDDPYQSLFKLRNRKPKCPSVHTGRYKVVGSTIVAVVNKPKGEPPAISTLNYFRYRRQKQAHVSEASDQVYHMELELRNIKNRNNCQLLWKRYSIHVVYRNGEETVSDFDLTPSNFPPFWFSRVKSYTAESEQPLK